PERAVSALTVGLIQHLQLAIEDGLRPAVRDDVMERLEQNVLLLVELQQLHPQDGAGPEIERRLMFAPHLDRNLPALLGLIQPAEIIYRQLDFQLGFNDLDRLAIDVDKAGPQALVPIDDASDRSAERLDIQFAVKPQRLRHVVFGARSFQLIDEP